jgi:DNA-binding response OmpR family regulator
VRRHDLSSRGAVARVRSVGHRSRHPDVNLGDAGANGVDVCRWLRDSGFSAPIVFLTGHAASDPRVVAASQIPNTRLLNKPVSVEILVGLLRPSA